MDYMDTRNKTSLKKSLESLSTEGCMYKLKLEIKNIISFIFEILSYKSNKIYA